MTPPELDALAEQVRAQVTRKMASELTRKLDAEIKQAVVKAVASYIEAEVMPAVLAELEKRKAKLVFACEDGVASGVAEYAKKYTASKMSNLNGRTPELFDAILRGLVNR